MKSALHYNLQNAFLLHTIFELFTDIAKFVLSGVVYSIPRILPYFDALVYEC